ncbi:MAG TPA: RES domain-containing protein [Rhizomicrobium sp.]|jgi:RES domain-containing protein|nr:RES domain-containing protein [Rhizomicrobium sp.]
MTALKTDRVLTCYRIGDPNGEFPIYGADGARLYPGRWNTHTSPVIYTSEHYSTAMLEKLVQLNLELPANQHFITITIPNGVTYEVFQTPAHPGWDSKNEAICKVFGEAWYAETRSALLIVPSLPARIERNFLINPLHADAKAIAHGMPEPVWWDARLFAA